MLECLNECSGLLSLFAVVASVASVAVTVVIYRKQKKAQMMDWQDELESLTRPRHPLEMDQETRERNCKIELLKKKMRRK